ncbi:MAG TPA: SEC-C metal-binding domain-containing protein [Bacillota bacterium]|nr:SEC-C metal-binding domain-containing protein [Bacillota bacterium]
MRTPNEVKPFILHPERVVRDYAVEYFQESFSPDPELTPLVLQVCEKDPDDKNIRLMLSNALNFTQTPETLARYFRLFQASQINREWYAQIILHAEPDLLRQFPEEVASLPKPLQIKIGSYLQMAHLNTADLWCEFLNFGAENAGKHIEEFDYQYGVFIARELAKRDDLPREEVLELLQTGYPEDYDGYLDIYVTVLAGELRLDEAIPVLLENIRKEGDVLSEEAEAALTRIGSETVILKLRECFPGESWCFRLYTANIFGNVKLDVCEEILLELLRKETDQTIITILAKSICKLLSRQGIPAVRNLIYEGYERRLLNLVEDLYCNCIINGVDLPELQRWREEIAEEAEEFEEMMEDELLDEDEIDDWDEEDEEDDDWDEDEDDDDEEESKFVVKQLTSAKTGRNELCPCGSGKKYKKCCLQKN